MTIPTQKQTKLIKLIVENLGTPKNTRTMRELMLEVGYSKSQADNPFQVLRTKTIQNGIQDFLGLLDDKRRQAITHITEDKLKKSSGRDLAYIGDIMTRNHQLLSGRSTDNHLMLNIDEEQAERILKRATHGGGKK